MSFLVWFIFCRFLFAELRHKIIVAAVIFHLTGDYD
jgi:hypothetical protein